MLHDIYYVGRFHTKVIWIKIQTCLANKQSLSQKRCHWIQGLKNSFCSKNNLSGQGKGFLKASAISLCEYFPKEIGDNTQKLCEI